MALKNSDTFAKMKAPLNEAVANDNRPLYAKVMRDSCLFDTLGRW